MSVHLDTLFFSVCIVGFSGTPVHIRHRRQIDPPEHRNSSCRTDRHAREHNKNTHVETNATNILFKAYKYSPPATPNILIPIQAAAAWPVPTWKQHMITDHDSFISNVLSYEDSSHLWRILKSLLKITDQTFKSQELPYQADHVRLLGFISDGHQMSFLLVTPHKGHVKVHDICVIIVITDAVVLPPARVRAALRSWRKKTLINKHHQ